jgi:hypothetical protein
MPIKSEHESQIGIMLDGKFTELTPIPEFKDDTDKTCSATPLDDSKNNLFFEGDSGVEIVGTFGNGIFPFRDHEQTMSVSITHNRSYRRFIRSIRKMFPVPSNKSNNWLRMHGYPMVRKARCI